MRLGQKIHRMIYDTILGRILMSVGITFFVSFTFVSFIGLKTFANWVYSFHISNFQTLDIIIASAILFVTSYLILYVTGYPLLKISKRSHLKKELNKKNRDPQHLVTVPQSDSFDDTVSIFARGTAFWFIVSMVAFITYSIYLLTLS